MDGVAAGVMVRESDVTVRSVRGDYTYKEDEESVTGTSRSRAPVGSLPMDWARIMEEFPNEKEHIEKFQERIGVRFHQQDTLFRAFTHASAWTYHPVWAEVIPDQQQCYETLECVGDSVFSTIVLDNLMEHGKTCLSTRDLNDEADNDDWQFFNERWLTVNLHGLVRAEMQTVFARELDLAPGIMVERLLMESGGDQQREVARDRIMADVFEAIIGALYFDQGFEETKRIVSRWVRKRIEALPLRSLQRDPKCIVLEMFSRAGRRFEMEAVLSSGPSHAPFFLARLLFDGKELASAYGPTKRQAINAASSAYIEACSNLPISETAHGALQFRGASETPLAEPDRAMFDHDRVVKVCKGKHPTSYVNDTSKWLLGEYPRYVEVNLSGEAHCLIFTLSMQLNGEELARASGRSKKLAKEQAACMVVKEIDEHGVEWLASMSKLPVLETLP